MFRLTATASLLIVCCWVSHSQAQSMWPPLNVELSYSMHPQVFGVTEDSVRARIENSATLYQYLAVHPECSDRSACVGLTPRKSSSQFGQPNDKHDQISNKEEADSMLLDATYEGIAFKVVTTILINGHFAAGYSENGRYNGLVAADSRTSTYAHEFGHMRGLHDNNDCDYYIMNNSATNPHKEERDTINQAQADSLMYGYAFLGAGHMTTATCPINEAALADFTAYVSQGGVHVTFKTLWESGTQSFEVIRVEGPDDDILYSLGAPALLPDEAGRLYEVVDPMGTVGDNYVVLEHRTALPDLPAGPVSASAAGPTYAGEPTTYSPDSLATVISTLSDGVGVIQVGLNCTATPPAYAILCPDSLSGALDGYAAIWRNRGVDARVVTRSFVDSCFGGYRDPAHLQMLLDS